MQKYGDIRAEKGKSMISNRKIRLMAQINMYEENEGREDIKLAGYFRSDYVRLHILRSFVAVTIGYVIVVAMYLANELDYLVKEAVNLDYVGMAMTALGYYIVILAVYVGGTVIYCLLHYNASRNKLAKYFKMLRRMRSFYEEEEK